LNIGENMEYTLIYSDRRTISASIKDGILIVRAPRKMPKSIIEQFLSKHECWIEKHLRESAIRKDKFENMSEREISNLKNEARRYLTLKTEYYSNIMSLKHGRITITSAKTRFGSCSSKGNISYSYRLMLYPEAAREYVVVHELAHLLEMNHSKRFYAIIEKYLPDYKERKKLLKLDES